MSMLKQLINKSGAKSSKLASPDENKQIVLHRRIDAPMINPNTDQDLRQRSRNPRPWATVAWREMKTKLTDKTFLGTTFFTLLILVAGFVVVPKVIAWASAETIKVVPQSAKAAQIIETANHMVSQADDQMKIELLDPVSDLEQGKQVVLDDKADVFLAEPQSGQPWRAYYTDEPSRVFKSGLEQAVSQTFLLQTGERAGLSPQQIMSETTVTGEDLSSGDTNSGHGLSYFISLAFAVLFLTSSMTFGMMIAQSVVEEKQSRVVEILLSSVSVRSLLFGKVGGNTVLAFLQMLLYAAVALIGVKFTSMTGLLSLLSTSIFWFLLFFIFGFLALSCVWAAAGALASRVEDLQSTTMPLTMLLTVVYVLGFTAQGSFRVMMSYVPIVSSVLMPARMADGEAVWWEAILSLLITVLFAYVTVYIGSRIYRRTLLQTNGKLGYLQALRIKD